jgi:hypothetical protein
LGYISAGKPTMFQAVESVKAIYEEQLAATRKKSKQAINDITELDINIENQKLDLTCESDRSKYWKRMMRMLDAELKEWKDFWPEGFDHWAVFRWEVEEKTVLAKAAMELVVHREEGRRRLRECMAIFLQEDVPLPDGFDLRYQVLRRLMGIIADYATGIERLEVYPPPNDNEE